MYELIIQDHFSAAHQLKGYSGACENLHGHNWKVEVEISAQTLDSIGLAIDFKILKQKIKAVLNAFDHHVLNELLPFQDINPSAENIARVCFEKLKESLSACPVQIKKVRVWETEKAGASFSPND